MNMTDMILNKLQNDLKNFGLNPMDWTLRKIGQSRYQVSHVSEDDFKFLGQLEMKTPFLPTWKNLELLSL
ncbi:hypothetical protein D3C87_241610 [compost metagenome]